MTRSALNVAEHRGSSSVELALLVPVLMVMLGLLLAGGRLWFDRTTVTEAAQTAARAASLSRTAGQALVSGDSAGRQSLDTAGLECSQADVSIDAGAFARPVGSPGAVSSTVTCAVGFGDILLPGMPGSITLVGHGTSALDTYRSRVSGFMNSEGSSGANPGGG